jgi:hypothetical protein
MRLYVPFVLALLFTLACSDDERPPAGSTSSSEAPAATGTGPAGATAPSSNGTLYGVSLSPRSFEGDDFTRFFEEALQAGEAVSWAGDWAQLDAEGEAPDAVVGLAGRYGYTPVIIANLYRSGEGVLRPLDATNLTMYEQRAVDFAERYKPPYLGLGVEVNILREDWPEDFEAFVGLFDATYDAVKAVSPQTQVFTVFQLERLQGLHGGLFGGAHDPSQAQWDIFERFEKADFFAFTTYPGIVFGTPAEIPADHYTAIRQHTDKPIAFTEVGWPAVLDVEGWESDEAEQAAFVRRFFELSQELSPEIVLWSFLYDQGLSDPFRGLGLLRDDGSRRPAWQAWVEGQ